MLRLILIGLLVVFAQAGGFLQLQSSQDIIIPPSKIIEGSPTKFMVIVPGGLVPNQNYTLIAKSIQENVGELNVHVGIVSCLANLCDPAIDLNSKIDNLIKTFRQTQDKDIKDEDIFIGGHSLGAVGAAYFYYKNQEKQISYGGLIQYGSQNFGNHTDFKGNLGFPMDLKYFQGSFLAVVGELDMMSSEHVYRMTNQWVEMQETEQSKKMAVLVPLMDHSDFCPGFKVKGDIQSELSQSESVKIIGQITGNWIMIQHFGLPKSTKQFKYLSEYIKSISLPIVTPFLQAKQLEEQDVCKYAQQVLSDLDDSDLYKLNFQVIVANSSANAEHTHTKFVTSEDKQSMNITIGSFPFENLDKLEFKHYFVGAKDITCKLLSADAIAKELGNEFKDFKNSCKDVNKKSFEIALELVKQKNPTAYERFLKQGKTLQFLDDYSAFMGPQFVFATELKLDISKQTVQSPTLLSPLSSRFYPGNHYCKVLSPASAVEWITTYGLQNRYE